MRKKFKIEQLDVEIFDNDEDMGLAAANFV